MTAGLGWERGAEEQPVAPPPPQVLPSQRPPVPQLKVARTGPQAAQS